MSSERLRIWPTGESQSVASIGEILVSTTQKKLVRLRDIAIVLIDEIDQQIDAGKDRYNAILDAAVSRLRPVVLAAATTILGLIPLPPDVFFVNMAITMIAGLGFATILTLIVAPTLHAIFFGARVKDADTESGAIARAE